MGRKATPQPLTLTDSNTKDHDGDTDPTPAAAAAPATQSSGPLSPRSRLPSPFGGKFVPRRPATAKSTSEAKEGSKSNEFGTKPPCDDDTPDVQANSDHSQTSALVSLPVLRNEMAEGKRSAKGGFFHFSKSSKGSASLLVPNAMHQRPSSREPALSPGSDSDKNYEGDSLRDSPYAYDSLSKPGTSRSELSLSSMGNHEGSTVSSPSRRNKSKTFARLGRSRSAREGKDEIVHSASSSTNLTATSKSDLHEAAAPLRTAPVAQDRSFRDMMNSTVRNRSADWNVGANNASDRESSRVRDQRALAATMRENSGSTFFSGLRNSSTRAADMISKGLFGKSSRSGSSSEKDTPVDDENYVLRVINLPLVEQTRLTRISKRLEKSRDKTEFWMPAFPWRAIDYLNYKGCEIEGLYRIPGSGPQVKKWQRRFDEYGDVDLFAATDLYDINIIGSMLKAWLRELPNELFPKETQERIARECAGSKKPPQILVDELSNLSPFKYYLLFAVTCHLSLLLAHSDKNKMDFRNLCICFQPCMKIDAFCFKFLVCDWRDCWKGCKNEAKYIEEEYMLFDQPPPPEVLAELQHSMRTAAKNRNRSEASLDFPEKPTNRTADSRMRAKNQSQGIDARLDGVQEPAPQRAPATQTKNTDTPEGSKKIQQLSPIEPLSPLGF